MVRGSGGRRKGCDLAHWGRVGRRCGIGLEDFAEGQRHMGRYGLWKKPTTAGRPQGSLFFFLFFATADRRMSKEKCDPTARSQHRRIISPPHGAHKMD